MNPRNQKRRDWFRILRDLMAVDVSMSKVAKACGRDNKTVAHWSDGGEPKDSDARVVLALYAKFCPEKYAEHCKEFTPLTEEMVWSYLEGLRGQVMQRMNQQVAGVK